MQGASVRLRVRPHSKHMQFLPADSHCARGSSVRVVSLQRGTKARGLRCTKLHEADDRVVRDGRAFRAFVFSSLFRAFPFSVVSHRLLALTQPGRKPVVLLRIHAWKKSFRQNVSVQVGTSVGVPSVQCSSRTLQPLVDPSITTSGDRAHLYTTSHIRGMRLPRPCVTALQAAQP